MFNELFYTIFQDNRKQIVFGERPTAFAHVGNITMRALEQHQTYLKRLENFPLVKAEYYKNLKETTGAKSVRALSEITGEDWSYIAKLLRILKLPPSIQDFLRINKEPHIVKRFHLKRLLELARISHRE
ncbi:MAG: hypothetical protein A3G33_11205 [Omnitrophica bacterium RIFCSPLOWO2_12_FULL_44_17]|uniref:ParB/Spo0J HTH domain-containing protein n=1 Tax=Candidatus Danuiimicrobium aquiferis TaxID=1801832 RepID=A0A1G1KRX2_9BACT|nr:MAG: hypothetical protein A3B72_09040 [Omnitrophica bacterium RIFCSPHIGHO2_02_FULL_45_28]OGW88455.1 MAG: hypothetical protein A3E74_03300 [Omnitrophica bacterium RIFCSPHIGHO2_12_FULL_44_12]OGW95565.1 MAG: hypothetical protein A3G33_11205 [Omnitrophica bacterium RIFCSPLOWO2_12_FULL_44_17]OGX03720.1 MAG: hypothetical protein A3J12_01285 [Omnitrophica bacterium RIFCSPLOWO2_02_FULL_44_11]